MAVDRPKGGTHLNVPGPFPIPPVLQGLMITPTQFLPMSGDLAVILGEWRHTGGHLWLDITAPDPPILEELKREFQVDRQALAQVLDPAHKAHVREYEDYFFVQLPMPARAADCPGERRRSRSFATEELDIFCSREFILTLHANPQPTLRALWETSARSAGQRWEGRWPDRLLYSIGDAVLSSFYPHLEWLEDQHDRLERLIFRDRRSQIQRVVAFKRDLHAVRRVIAPLRDAIASLAKRDFIFLDEEHRYLFDDLYARSMRLLELVANLHTLFDGLLNADLSIQNTRMNEVMKTLTVMATIMMPLTVLTGFFGMNFDAIPGLHSPVAFWGTTAGMAGLAAGFVWFFRRRGWW